MSMRELTAQGRSSQISLTDVSLNSVLSLDFFGRTLFFAGIFSQVFFCSYFVGRDIFGRDSVCQSKKASDPKSDIEAKIEDELFHFILSQETFDINGIESLSIPIATKTSPLIGDMSIKHVEEEGSIWSKCYLTW